MYVIMSTTPREWENFSMYNAKIKQTRISLGNESGYPGIFGNGQEQSIFFLYFKQQYLLVNEEVYLIDTIGLIGSVGGSLGLFIGFSFFNYIVDGCNFLLSYIKKNWY